MDEQTEQTPFIPCNPLETALVAARKGEIPLAELMAMLLDSDLAVPTATEVAADGSGFSPVVLDREGTAMVAVFSSLDRVATLAEHARFALTINARAFLGLLSKGVGVVLNPGFSEGLDIGPEGVGDMLRDLAKQD